MVGQRAGGGRPIPWPPRTSRLHLRAGRRGHPPPAGGGAGAGSRRAAALEAQALGGHARACARGKQTARRKGDRRVF